MLEPERFNQYAVALEPEEALRQGLQLPFALLRSLSQVSLGPTPPEVDRSELLEARFFDSQREIRLFALEDGWRSQLLQEDGQTVFIDKTYQLENPRFGRSLSLRRILDWDEDGQTYIKYTRLIAWEGGAS